MLKFDKRIQSGRARKEALSKPDKGPESVLQSQCENYLEWLNIAYIRIPDKIYQIVFSRKSKSPIWSKGYLTKFLKGVPDLTVLFKSGRFMCIELKSAKGKQTMRQKIWAKSVGLDNYKICRSFDSFRELIDKINRTNRGSDETGGTFTASPCGTQKGEKNDTE